MDEQIEKLYARFTEDQLTADEISLLVVALHVRWEQLLKETRHSARAVSFNGVQAGEINISGVSVGGRY